MNFQNLQYKNSTLLAVNQKVAIRITIVAAGDNHIQRNQSLAAITQVAFKNSSPFKDWKPMILLLNIQILLILQCLCTVWSSIVTIIPILKFMGFWKRWRS